MRTPEGTDSGTQLFAHSGTMKKTCCAGGVQTLALLLALCAAARAQCDLEGTWINELNSNMTLSKADGNGLFSGVYNTRVSLMNTTIITSPLVGYQQSLKEPTIGFTVNWKFSGSITSWVGQCFHTPQGDPFLVTTWLLRSQVGKVEDTWTSTRVGQDVFFRIM
ncbi:avidin-like [Pleurodeles waltl]|uniref:avidin-like n=1 Tax=Pleurodeles waltl TaxID=8319 RepID=UPI003709516E